MNIVPYSKKHDVYLADENLKIGYIRGDIDQRGHIWTSLILETSREEYQRKKSDIDKFAAAIVEMPCMDSVLNLYDFCLQYPEARYGGEEDKTFKFFGQDNVCAYYVQLICREKDYNFYIHIFSIRKT
jgi:hypothetical protein